MIHNHWLSESWCIILSKVVVNHDVLCWAQWFGIMVYNAEPVVVNNGWLCWASGCELWFVMLSQWLWITVCYPEPGVVNHGELWCASGYESWCIMLSQWLCIMVCYAEPVIVRISTAKHNSQPLTQHHTSLFTTTGTVKLTMIHIHWLSITHHDWQPLAQYNTP
jgi:hypothetical protein